jgi:uncharacterized membrane protein HdeD (DUF308 family)
MFKFNFTNSILNFVSGPWWLFMLLGGNLMLFGILIFVFPELLAYLVGGFFLFAGIFVVSIALKLKRVNNEYKEWEESRWVEIE